MGKGKKNRKKNYKKTCAELESFCDIALRAIRLKEAELMVRGTSYRGYLWEKFNLKSIPGSGRFLGYSKKWETEDDPSGIRPCRYDKEKELCFITTDDIVRSYNNMADMPEKICPFPSKPFQAGGVVSHNVNKGEVVVNPNKGEVVLHNVKSYPTKVIINPGKRILPCKYDDRVSKVVYGKEFNDLLDGDLSKTIMEYTEYAGEGIDELSDKDLQIDFTEFVSK